MKKLLFAVFCALGISSIASASSMYWKFAGNNTYAGYSVYLVLASAFPSSITSADSLTGVSFANGTIAVNGRSVYASGTATSAGTETYNTFSDGAVSFYFVVINTTDKTYWQSSTITGTGYTAPATATTSTGLLDASTAINTGWVSYATVPEPASVGLLMLGLCALGLKRKIA